MYTQSKENLDVKKQTLHSYIDCGFTLYPAKLTEDKRPAPICKILEENKINSHEKLEEFMNGRGQLITQEGKIWQNTNKIDLFVIYPSKNKLFCIDIDSAQKYNGEIHGTQGDGISEFKEFIKKLDLTEKQESYFKDFPNNFPCYVKTPSGGLHLYFKLSKIPENWKFEQNLLLNGKSLNIEGKINTQITCAGSVKEGREYILFGSLKDIPIIPTDLLNAFSKPRIIQNQTFKKQYKQNYDSNNSKMTPEIALEKGKSYEQNVGHNRMFYNVARNFAYWYKRTNENIFNEESCKNYITSDTDFLSWTDANKLNQITESIKQAYK